MCHSLSLLLMTLDSRSIDDQVCMEYWNSLAESLFNDNMPQFGASRALMVGRGLYDTPRHSLYKPKLTALRVIMVERMAKPEEVLVVEKDGEVNRFCSYPLPLKPVLRSL